MSFRVSWGTGIALTYAVFALATSGFVAFAMGRRVDLVSSDYYERSLQLDRRLDARRNAVAIGDALVFEQHPSTLTISLRMVDARSATGRILFYRSSDAHADREMSLALDAAGRQEVTTRRDEIRQLVTASRMAPARTRLLRGAATDTAMMPLVTGFVLGLASSAHCVVMCGPLVLAIGPRRGAGSAWTALGRLLPYHAGRIAVYVALAFPAGWVAEAAGRGGLGIALGVVIAAVLLAAACGATRRPGWRGVSGLVGRRVARLAAVAASWRQICPRTAAVVAGMANGLVPCGLVYAAALAAAGWGTFAGAWAMMLGFGLGTLPALAVVSLSPAALPHRLRPAMQGLVPVVLALAAVLLLLRAFVPAAHHHMAAGPDRGHLSHQATDLGHYARHLHGM